MNINLKNVSGKIVLARISAVTLAFAAGGTLSHVIPGKPGLIVTAVAGAVNAVLPRIQKDAGIFAAIRQYLAASKAAKAQKRQALLKGAMDDLLKTGAYVWTKDGLKAASEVAAEAAVAKDDILAPVKANEDAAAALVTEAKDIAAL